MNFTYKVGSVNLNSSNSLVNKYLLKDFIYNNDLDVIFLQEVSYDNFSFIPSYTPIVNLSDSSGTAILIRKIFDYSSPLLDPNGRISSVIIDRINYINVYAFSGTNRKKERENLFLNNMSIHLNKAGSGFCVVGGDFNCILNAFDTAGSSKNYSVGLKRLIELFSFKDVAVELQKNVFTFTRGDSKSRLDRFYASSAFLDNVMDFETLPVAFSDHHGIVMKIKSLNHDFSFRGRGYWKINSTLVQDNSISADFSDNFETWKLRHQYTDDKNLWWNDIGKIKFKQFYKNKSWELNQRISNEKAYFYRKMSEWMEKKNNNEETLLDIKMIKSRLFEIESNRMKHMGNNLKESSFLQSEMVNLYQVSAQIKRFQSNSNLTC